MELGIDWHHVFTVTQAEFESNFDAILEKICNGCSPALVLCDNHQNVVVFEWEDYWNRYGELHPPGERERIEERCMELYRKSP